MKLSLPALIAKISTLADNTIRLVVDCQEMTPEQTTALFTHKGRLGWFFFHESEIKEIRPEELPPIRFEKWEKHPSQRQRALLYRLWEQEKTDLSFENYYRQKMDKINEWLKSKLNDDPL